MVVLVFVVVGHWIACLWIVFGHQSRSEEDGSWMDSLELNYDKQPMKLLPYALKVKVYHYALKFSIGEINIGKYDS